MTAMKKHPHNHTCALNAISSESVLIHYVRVNFVYMKISCQFEFHFALIHVNTSKEQPEPGSEIFNSNEISYRFEFISLLMWMCSQCCLTFLWIEFQMLLRCCLIHVTMIIRRDIFYLIYLCPCLGLDLFMSYIAVLFVIFNLVFIVINI